MERASNLRKRIDYKTIDNIRSFISDYDEEMDSLILHPKIPAPAVSVDWDGDLWVRINPENGEIVGIEIEDYKGFFFKKYHSLLKGIPVTHPVIKEVIIVLLGLGPKPYTKKVFTTDLERVCRRVAV